MTSPINIGIPRRLRAVSPARRGIGNPPAFFAPAPRPHAPAGGGSRRWLRPQRLAAACHSRAQQGPARRSTAGHAAQDGVGWKFQGFPRAKASGRSVWESGGKAGQGCTRHVAASPASGSASRRRTFFPVVHLTFLWYSAHMYSIISGNDLSSSPS